MSQNPKIWKITLLLLLGLFAFIYILANTAADIYYMRSPVIGIYTAIAPGAGFVAVTGVAAGGPADIGGVAKGDSIVIVDETPVRDDEQFTEILNSHRVGDRVKLTILRGGQTIERTIKIERRFNVYTRYVLTALLPRVIFCYALLLIGTFVFLKKIEDQTAHIFYLMVLFWALAMWQSFRDSYSILNEFLPGGFHLVRLLFWPLAIGLLLHFTLIFPIGNKFFVRHRKPTLLYIYFPTLFLAPYFFAEIRGLYLTDKPLQYGWYVLFAAHFSFAIYALSKSARYKEDPHIAKQAEIMLRGTLVSLVLPTAYYFLSEHLWATAPFSQYVIFLLILWPATLAYVIIKHRFMDIDVIVKRGVAYALMSGFVIAAYFLLVVGVGKLVLYLTGSTNQLVTIVSTLLIAAFFNPVKNRVRLFVDQRFFPSRFTYRQAIRSFSHQLINVVDLEKLLDSLYTFFSDTMRIQPVVIFWEAREPGTFCAMQQYASNMECASFTRADKVIQKLEKEQTLVDLSPLKEQPDLIAAGEMSRWNQLKSELVLPLVMKGKLIGLFSLGEKEDAEPYYNEDIELLQTLNDQTNISLENALLTEELRQQERLKKELEVARRIQLSTLPQSDPQVPGLDISGISIPALEVGGDYYDYLDLVDGRFAVVVGDVSGKGTSAALYMSQLKGILKTAAKFHRSLTELMAELNSIAFNSLEDTFFITLMCGAFDLKRRKFNLVRAGHLPLVYYSVKERACRQLVPKGIGVGLDAGEVFKRELEEVEIKFTPGDIFLFYSDGIIEARNPQGQEFETVFLETALQQNGELTASNLRKHIINEVQTFAGNSAQIDDMTLVVVRTL